MRWLALASVVAKTAEKALARGRTDHATQHFPLVPVNFDLGT